METRWFSFVLAGLLTLAACTRGADSSPAPTPSPSSAQNSASARTSTAAAGNQPADPVQDLITFSSKYTTVAPLNSGPDNGKVASLTALMMKRFQYYRRGLDTELAGLFLQRYFEMLDPMHIHFVKSDLDEFKQLADRLPDLTVKRGDTSPAYQIFARFLQRMDERVEFVAERLRENRFEFSGDDRYTPNRRHEDWPADTKTARELWAQHLRYEYLQEKLNKQKPEQITKTLSSRYKRMLRSWGELDHEDVLQVYLTALTQAYDPHSDYMGKAQLENFAISMKLSLFGIGALLRSEDGYCKLESLTPGGPAARSKRLKPNDRIIAVQQPGQEPVDVVDMKLTKVVEMIRGPKNTEVTLTVIPADATDPSERKIISLVRDEIKLEDQEAKSRLIEWPDDRGGVRRLGVIDLPSFYASFDIGSDKEKAKSAPKSTTADVTRLLRRLTQEGAQGIILDLRRNGGGSLEEAIQLTGLFIREGPVVQVKDAAGDITTEPDPDPNVVYDGPLVVLTSRFSASASEILAAALQDYGRALIVGDTCTHGKGTVQTIYELNRWGRFPESYNPGALKVTIRKFYRANGWSTQLRGVTPDIILPSVANYMEVGESAQELPMPWDTIPSAMFEKLDRIQPHLEDLRRRSEARQSSTKDFSYVQEDIELYRKLQADKSLSLNEERRLEEKKEQESRSKARKEERLKRPAPALKSYEFTLKNVGEPGLPAPVSVTNSPPAEAEGKSLAALAEKLTNTDEDEADEEKAPVIDVTLEEAKAILSDLVTALSPKGSGVPATVRN